MARWRAWWCLRLPGVESVYAEVAEVIPVAAERIIRSTGKTEIIREEYSPQAICVRWFVNSRARHCQCLADLPRQFLESETAFCRNMGSRLLNPCWRSVGLVYPDTYNTAFERTSSDGGQQLANGRALPCLYIPDAAPLWKTRFVTS